MLVIVARCTVKPERVAEFLAVSLDDARGSVRDERDCLRFDVAQDSADPVRIWVYEVYRDRAAFDHHLTTPHFKRWNEAVQDWFAEPVQSSLCESVFLTEEASGERTS